MRVELDQEDIQAIAREVAQELKSVPVNGKTEVEDALFTVDSLADYLQVSKQWIYERIHMKEIPHIKIGKFPRFRKSEIDKWLDGHKVPAVRLPLGVLY